LGRIWKIDDSSFISSCIFHNANHLPLPFHQFQFLTMAWRSQGSTGSNNIPLGNKRRFGGDPSPQHDDGGYNPTKPQLSDGGYKRGRSPVRCEYLPSSYQKYHADSAAAEQPSGDGERRRKKRNRWGDATENKAAGLMGLPTAIMANMTSEQLEAYTLHLRIEEISQKLRIDDVVPADGDR
jgi:splicing factor 1